MMFFKQIFEYFNVFQKYVGKRLLIVFVLTFIAAISEGFGIAMLLPLLDVTDINVGESGNNFLIKEILNSVLKYFRLNESLIGILIFISVVFLIKGLIIFIANGYHSYLRAKLQLEIKSLAFDKYTHMSYEYYIKKNTGHFVNIINAQIDGLIISFNSYKNFLTIVITTTAYFATAFLLAWNFALMAVFSGLILLFLFRGLNRYVHDLSRKVTREQGILNKYIIQTMHGFKYLSATNQVGSLRIGVIGSVSRVTGYMRNQGIAQALTLALNEPVAIFLSW